MLLLGSKSITVEGVQVFADHANPNQFWYLPGPVSLARDPTTREADFTFLKFRPAQAGGPARGGGFLMFVVNLKPDPHLERRILARVAALAPGDAVLSPVQFDDGTVECIGLTVQGGGGARPSGPVSLQVTEQIQGSTVPSLAGYNDAAFSLTLTQEGATLLEDALTNLTQPVGVVYNLKYTGMRPALEVKITADYKRIFDQLTGGLSGQIYWVQASLEAGFEQLRQSGAIKIEVTNFTGQADMDQKAQWALDFFRDRLVSQWFEPTLIPGQFAGGGALNVPGLDAATRGNAVRPAPTKPPPAPGPGGGGLPAPQASPFLKAPTLGTATGGLNLPAQGVVTPKPAAPAGSDATAATGNPPAPAAKPKTPATAGLGFNPTTAVNKGAPLQNMGNPSTPQVALRLKFIHQDELKTETLEYRISEATQRTYAPVGFFGLLASDLDLGRHFRSIDLDDAFYREFKVTVQAPIDYARLGLTSATIRLDYGDPVGDPAHLKHTDFLFDGAHAADREWKVFLDQRLDTSYRYQVEYHFDPGSTWKARRWDYTLPGQTTEDRTLFLNPYQDFAFLEVRVFPNRIDAGVITATDVVLSYTSPGGWTRQDMLTFVPGGDAQLWRLRLEDRDATQYTYHFVHHIKGGGTITTDPVTSSASALPVDDPFAGALDLTFVPVFDPATVRFAFADVHYEDPANHYTRDLRVQFDGTSMAPVTQHLSLRDPARSEFSVRVTIVGKTGSISTGPTVTRKDTLIAVMPGA